MLSHRSQIKLGVGIAALAGVLGGGALSDAQACTPWFEAVELSTRSVPETGLLVGRLECLSCSVDDLVVTTAAGAEVPGTFVLLNGAASGLFSFEPDDSWILAGSYEVGLNDQHAEASYYHPATFDIVASQTATTQLRLRANQEGQAPVTCTAPGSGYWDSCGVGSSTRTFYPSYKARAELNFVRQGDASQYSYTVVWSADGESDGSSSSAFLQDYVSHSFEGAPVEVCGKVLAYPLNGGPSVDVGETCLRTDDDPTFFADRVATDDEFDEFLRGCPSAPQGFDQRWCEAFADEIASGSCADVVLVTACEKALAACTGDSNSESGMGGAGAADAGPVGEERAPVPESDAPSAADPGRSVSSVSGCSMSLGGSRSGGGWAMFCQLLGLAMAAIWIARRRWRNG